MTLAVPVEIDRMAMPAPSVARAHTFRCHRLSAKLDSPTCAGLSMNWADITIIGIILVSAVISLFRGFVREILSLVAWIVSFWAAATFAPQAATLLQPYLSIPTARTVLAFIGVLIVALVLTGLVNYLIGSLIEKTGLSGTDRMLGGIFGVLRGVAIVAIAVLIAGLTEVPGASWWQQSRAIAPFETAALKIVDYMPPDLAKHFSY
jgi:membrane protein required for colicin V production